MKDLIISLEATCDLPKELAEKYRFKITPMNFYVDGKEFCTDADTVATSGIYEKMENDARTSTSQISEATYEEYFGAFAKTGKPVLHIAFSSGISGTYRQAVMAAEALNAAGCNIYVVDSRCGGAAQGLLGILCAEYAEGAENVGAVIKYIEEIRFRMEHAFTVDNLKYLARGGRLGGLAAFVGNMLKIKPVMKVDEHGKLMLDKKVLSRQRAIRTLFADYKEARDVSCEWCFISHAGCEKDARILADMILAETGEAPVVYDLGPVLGSHAGPGTLAMFYLSVNSRKKEAAVPAPARYRLARGRNI